MSQCLQFPDVLPDLLGESVRLRELTEEDIPAWFERATDIESADLAGDPVPGSIDLGIPWLQRQRDKFRQKVALRWAIVPIGSTVSVGTVGLTILSDKEHTAEFGIVIARSYWGKGIGTSATNLINSYAFTILGLTQIQAEVLQRNAASIRLLEKTGFQRMRTIPATSTEPEELFLYVLSRPATSAT
jgi:[ribosomal protein S5]-alanine N-acetyltransferase